jgi:hypothetical protein
MKKLCFFFTLPILILIQSCLQPQVDHAIIEFTLEDGSKEVLNVGMNNYVLISQSDRQYIIRGKNFHENSADLEVVECSLAVDTNTHEWNILKVAGELRHFVFDRPENIIGEKSKVSVRITEVKTMAAEEMKTLVCHDNKTCCLASCQIRMCCAGGPGNCHDATCDCEPSSTCAQPKIPDIFSFAKLFSREKLNVHVKME